jgi:DnaJ-domain-containing protein 1
VVIGRERWRRRREAREAAAPEPDTVDLAGEEHAWWAGRDGLDAGVPKGKRRRPPEPEPAARHRSGFEDYFTEASLYDPTVEELPRTPQYDPYSVLDVDETATWEQITTAHRRLAKLHHPDRLVDPTPERLAQSEARIRDLNIAYTELRRRRGK